MPWAALVALLLVAQSLLLVLTIDYEAARAQERVDLIAAELAAEIKREVLRDVQRLQALQWQSPSAAEWHAEGQRMLAQRHALVRLEHRAPSLEVLDAVDTPFGPPLFGQMPRRALETDTELACAAARRSAVPTFSRSYFVPQAAGMGLEVMDVCVAMQQGGRDEGFFVGTFALSPLLETIATLAQARSHEFSFIEGDGTRLARAGMSRGAGVYRAERVVDLPGFTLQLRVDSAERRPELIPNLATALVLGLSIALFAVVVLLLHDVRRRAQVEAALAEALAFRKAMEDSLVTGLRARDLAGHITYANPAFCAMVGFSARELSATDPPPYWPPEQIEEYHRRQALRMAGGSALQAAREGFETVFMRKNGERFPVMIYEAPLVDGQGRHTGWMSAVLDVSAQRGIEELSRQQQERLQATARLATVGEMASLLSHELNQPLAAIASYANGSINLAAEPDAQTLPLLRQALQRIAEQAERAGRVIKSVHDFVRRRENVRDAIGVDQLFDAVLPLVRLQARKSGTRIELELPRPVPRVMCDRTMVEQVLLNLSRNAMQAMEGHAPPSDRVLVLRVRQTDPRWVVFSIIDAGPGIAQDVAQRLFTPFFTTRSEGMGLGLSLCRTVIEQHGGALDFTSPLDPAKGGTEFRFTLPAPKPSDPS